MPFIAPGYPVGKPDLAMRLDFAGGSNIVYVGYAVPNVLPSQRGWQIFKLLYDGSNNVIAIVFAGTDAQDNGSNDYDKVWNLRANYNYQAS